MNCRHCHVPLQHQFLDLGFAPPSNAYRTTEDHSSPEIHFPLKLYVCEHCWLVQTQDYMHSEQLFCGDYAYFSSVSTSWCDHAARYVEMIVRRLCLTLDSFVIEIASNDGYLLRNFISRGIPCLGVEPTASTADAAERRGVPVLRRFFGEQLARDLSAQGKQADLIIGNNVYAHVPDINDFTAGLKTALKPGGTVTLEFPHLMRLIDQVRFDTVYHEHFSYLSFFTVEEMFAEAGLRIYDVEELTTHGGSLRVYGCHADDPRPRESTVNALLAEEERQGLRRLATYDNFQEKVERVKDNLLGFLISQKSQGKKVAGYGAAAKGNTLLNYAGVKPDLLPYVCDAAPSKQGKFLPGSHIPILSPDMLKERRPDFILILPWNISDEIVNQHEYIRDWGGIFLVAVPEIKML